MAIKKAWRRELLPAEKRVNFKQLEDSWNSAEIALIDDLTPVLIQVIDRLETDLRKILDSENYGELRDLKIGYKDKLVGVFKAHMIEAFKFGKEGVYDEFKIQKTLTIEATAREFIAVKAETIVNDILDRIKASALFTTLSGIKAGFTTDQIISDVKGPNFKEYQIDKVSV